MINDTSRNIDLEENVHIATMAIFYVEWPLGYPRLYLEIIFIDGLKLCCSILQLYNVFDIQLIVNNVSTFGKKNWYPDPWISSIMTLWLLTMMMGKSDYKGCGKDRASNGLK